MTEIPDALIERALARLSPDELASDVGDALANGDYRLGLVLILAVVAQRRGLQVPLPALLKAAVAAEALLEKGR